MTEEDNNVSGSSNMQENVEFGYTRKDVILIGAGLIGAGYALYYGAQAFGVEATAAGNYVQLFIFLVICVGYISTYIFRVANKVCSKAALTNTSYATLLCFVNLSLKILVEVQFSITDCLRKQSYGCDINDCCKVSSTWLDPRCKLKGIDILCRT